jgi:hypothetical protein
VRFSIRVKSVVRFACAVLFALSFLPSIASAQVTATAPVTVDSQYMNRWDIFGGAQYSHFNPSSGRNISAINLLGWTGGATFYFRPVWGIEASERGIYGTINIPQNGFNVTQSKMSEYLTLFGPTFRLMRRQNYAAGMHVLIGAANGTFDKGFPQGVQPSQLNIYNNKLAFGAVIGAWGDYNLTPRFAVRINADYQPTRYGFSLQNEFAGSVGIVYRMGSLHK